MCLGYWGIDTKRITINKVLSNEVLAQQNQYVQVIPDSPGHSPHFWQRPPQCGTNPTPWQGVAEFGPLSALLHPLQRCIDWNRDILKKELGLLEEDIIDMPALFKLDKHGKAVPYFPNTVRGVPVLGSSPKNSSVSQDESPEFS